MDRILPLWEEQVTIERWDEVLSINGQWLRGSANEDPMATIQEARKSAPAVVVVVRKQRAAGGTTHGSGDLTECLASGTQRDVLHSKPLSYDIWAAKGMWGVRGVATATVLEATRV